MPALTYHCDLVSAGETVHFPQDAEVVAETDTDGGLRVWYRVLAQADADEEDGSEE